MNSIIDKIDAPRFWRIANYGYKLQQLSLKMKFDDGYRAECQRRTKVRINPDLDGGLIQIPFGVIVIRNFVKTVVRDKSSFTILLNINIVKIMLIFLKNL